MRRAVVALVVEAVSGTLTVTGLDDSSICVEVDYSDADKSVVGTISAEIV